MARYIDADEFLEGFYIYAYNQDKGFIRAVEQVIDDTPTADVEEVKHGEWIINTDDFTPKMRCTACGYNKPIISGINIKQKPNNYCPNCGAKIECVKI